MKKLSLLFTAFIAANAKAAGGFTWISAAQSALQTEIPEYILTFGMI